MESGWYYFALFLVMGVISPLFWLITLSTLLWLGRKFLSDRVGRYLFEHYWDPGCKRPDDIS